MARVGKYLVYNPRKGKPVKYYDSFAAAFLDADSLNKKEQCDILILKVVGNLENKTEKILRSELRDTNRRLEIIED